MVQRGDEEGHYCEADGEDDRYHDYEGEPTYVIGRLMLTPKQKEETQRHHLFRTRCTVDNRTLDGIIDGRSCENIIGKWTVSGSKLPLEKHSQSYTIGWIKSGG